MELPADRRDHRYYNSEEGQSHQNSSSSLPPSSSTSSSAAAAAAASADVKEEREYMFEKVVTPSDVGKLNRLVIPKQYAEHYFPLDLASNEKGGLLLSFEEDHSGRPWRFRYSYWNSSQSYVMTKGWSRFVKDKRLRAGDTVKFSRAASTGRLFIDWCHRLAPPDPPHLLRSLAVPWGWAAGLFVPPPTSSAIASAGTNSGASPMNYRSVGRPVPPMLLMGGRILDSVPVCTAEPKRVRLFGVNLDCSEQNEDYRQEDQSTVSSSHLPPPSPLQWRLSPTPAAPSRTALPQPPPAMDQE